MQHQRLVLIHHQYVLTFAYSFSPYIIYPPTHDINLSCSIQYLNQIKSDIPLFTVCFRAEQHAIHHKGACLLTVNDGHADLFILSGISRFFF